MNNKGEYGIKAYGKTFRFATKDEYKAYLLDWMMNTDGSERDRAVDAFVSLEKGINFTDTDK